MLIQQRGQYHFINVKTDGNCGASVTAPNPGDSSARIRSSSESLCPEARSSSSLISSFLPSCLTNWPPLILHYWIFPSSSGPLQTLFPLLGAPVFPQMPTSVNSYSPSPRKSHMLRVTSTSWIDYVLVFVLLDPLPFQQTIQDNLQVHISEIFDGYQYSSPALG